MYQQPNIRLLKAVVILLGVAILISGAVVIWGITTRVGGKAERGSVASAGLVRAGEPAAFGVRKLELPRSSRIIEMRPDGDRLLLRVRDVGGAEQIILLDMNTGERLGSFEIEALE
ncbi:MAG: hypothetical protein KIT81_14360 [Alphaproteobacteria bacterium]|nr:hypothetical protein [Alphaproteobacteria bacterium]